MTKSMVRFFLMASILGYVGIACKQDGVAPQSISDILNDNKSFSTLNAAVKYAGYQDAFKTSQLTLFAPNDAAFKASGFADASAITSQPIEKIRAILAYHLMTRKVGTQNLNDGDNQELRVFSNDLIYLSKNSKGISINGITTSGSDIEAANGIVHQIDRVLVPPTQTLEQLIKANPNLTLFMQAITKASTTNPEILKAIADKNLTFTVFAPNNRAMEAIGYSELGIKNATPAFIYPILLYHFALGRYFVANLATNSQIPVWGTPGRNIVILKSDASGLQVRGTGNSVGNVVPPSLMATNGVLHVVDKALIP